MISHKHKFVFIAVPKTGTTSAERVLHKYCIHFSYRKKHFTYSEYLNNKRVRETVNKDYFFFAFVRNPFDRLVSQFKFTGKKWWKKAGLSESSLCFENYVKQIVACNLPFSAHRYNSQIKSGQGDEDWSQLQYLSEDVDFIGRYENLQEDFNIICDKIGIPLQQLPHRNSTKHKHYTEYYDDETREIVAKKYAKDIEYFGYKFGE
jgi:chondroitin 4-sulfotransferase 11